MNNFQNLLNEHAGFTGESTPAFRFDQIGVTAAGTVRDMRTVPDQFNPGETKAVIDLDTADGLRTIWTSKAMLNSIARATITAAADLTEGGHLTITYSADGPATPGRSPAKLYTATYTPPSTNPTPAPAPAVADDDELF